MILRAMTILLLAVASLATSACSARQSEAPESRPFPRVPSMREFRASLESDAGKRYDALLRQRQLEKQAELEHDPALADYFRHMHAKEYDAAFARVSEEAARGNPQAQAELGALHLMGLGTPVDVDQTVKWLESAAMRGNAQAMSALGSIHADPKLGHLDVERAYKLLHACAIQLQDPCMLQFARIHLIEDARFHDPVVALAWIGEAMQQGTPGAVEAYDALAPKLDAGQIARAEEERVRIKGELVDAIKARIAARRRALSGKTQ